MAPARTSPGATRTLKVSGVRETDGCSSISMIENRVLRGYQGEARERGESESQTYLPVKWISKYCKYSIKLNIGGEYTYGFKDLKL